MGRPERPVDRSDPVLAELANNLRALRQDAGAPVYRRIGEQTHRSWSQLSTAASGRVLPTWGVTHAFVEACHGSVPAWAYYWRALTEYLVSNRTTTWRSPVPARVLTRSAPPVRELAWRIPEGLAPAFVDEDSTAQFCADLKQLLVSSGQSMRAVAKQAGYAVSTLSDGLAGHRLPAWDVSADFLQAIGTAIEEIRGPWRQRWQRLQEAAPPALQAQRTLATHPKAHQLKRTTRTCCQHCGAELRRERREPLCAPCQRKEQAASTEAPLLSREFWTEPDMGAALAAGDLATVCRLYRVRTRVRTQEQLAMLLGYSQPHVSRIERSMHRGRLEMLWRFVTRLHIPADLIFVDRPADERAAWQLAAFPAGIDRRPADRFGPLPDDYRVQHAPSPRSAHRYASNGCNEAAASKHPAADRAARINEKSALLYQLDVQFGADNLRSRGHAYLNQANQLLQAGNFDERAGRQLYAAVGELELCVGWLEFDAGTPERARALYREALTTARLADDIWLEVHALVSMSMQAVALDSPHEGLQLARAAQRALAGRPHPVVAAVAAMREARAWAKLADARRARAAIGRAREAYAARSADDPERPGWSQFLDEAELAGNAGMCELNLGHPGRAIRQLMIAAHIKAPVANRNQFLYTIRLADATRAMGDLTGAAELGQAALGMAVDHVTSTRTFDELRQFRTKMERTLRSAGGARFRRRFDTLIA